MLHATQILYALWASLRHWRWSPLGHEVLDPRACLYSFVIHNRQLVLHRFHFALTILWGRLNWCVFFLAMLSTRACLLTWEARLAVTLKNWVQFAHVLCLRPSAQRGKLVSTTTSGFKGYLVLTWLNASYQRNPCIGKTNMSGRRLSEKCSGNLHGASWLRWDSQVMARLRFEGMMLEFMICSKPDATS